MKIILTTKTYSLKDGTKTVFNLDNTETKEIKEINYDYIVDAMPYMRRLGGSEHAVRGYTARGYRVVELTSKSPCRTLKTVRTFDFS